MRAWACLHRETVSLVLASDLLARNLDRLDRLDDVDRLDLDRLDDVDRLDRLDDVDRLDLDRLDLDRLDDVDPLDLDRPDRRVGGLVDAFFGFVFVSLDFLRPRWRYRDVWKRGAVRYLPVDRVWICCDFSQAELSEELASLLVNAIRVR